MVIAESDHQGGTLAGQTSHELSGVVFDRKRGRLTGPQRQRIELPGLCSSLAQRERQGVLHRERRYQGVVPRHLVHEPILNATCRVA